MKYLVTQDSKCYRHCQDPSKYQAISGTDSSSPAASFSLVGAYVCPANYVSRVVYFAKDPNPDWFEEFLIDQVGARLRKKDIRMATRHGWELGGSAEEEIQEISPSHEIKEYYWTFYARSDDDKKFGTFLCQERDGGCGRLFNKLVSSESKLCPICSQRTN